MIDKFLFMLTLFAALGSGLMAGVFFAFSVSVMKALARLPPAEGMAAMQAINVAILNPLFLGVFLGTAVTSTLVIIAALMQWHTPDTVYLLTGGVLYLAGTFLVTAGFNVPKNEALAAIAPAHPDSATLWTDYLASWTVWNHIRTVAALIATALFTIALGY